MRRNFYNWLIAVLGMIALMSVSQVMDGSLSYVFENDATPISLIIYCLFVVTTIGIGVSAFKNNVKNMQWFHFASRHSVTLGLLGTVLGLVILTSTGVEAENVAGTIETLKRGMGTALLTTAMGILSSFLIDIQLALVEGPSDAVENQKEVPLDDYDC